MITDRSFLSSPFSFVISYVLLTGTSEMGSRGRRIVEGVAAVDALWEGNGPVIPRRGLYRSLKTDLKQNKKPNILSNHHPPFQASSHYSVSFWLGPS